MQSAPSNDSRSARAHHCDRRPTAPAIFARSCTSCWFASAVSARGRKRNYLRLDHCRRGSGRPCGSGLRGVGRIEYGGSGKLRARRTGWFLFFDRKLFRLSNWNQQGRFDLSRAASGLPVRRKISHASAGTFARLSRRRGISREPSSRGLPFAPCERNVSSLRPVQITGDWMQTVASSSRARAFIMPQLLSKVSSAADKQSSSPAAAIRLDRPPCFSRKERRKCCWSFAATTFQKACRAISRGVCWCTKASSSCATLRFEEWAVTKCSKRSSWRIRRRASAVWRKRQRSFP